MGEERLSLKYPDFKDGSQQFLELSNLLRQKLDELEKTKPRKYISKRVRKAYIEELRQEITEYHNQMRQWAEITKMLSFIFLDLDRLQKNIQTSSLFIPIS